MLGTVEPVTVDGIARALSRIDPAFVDSPQYLNEPLSQRYGADVVLKVETMNPIRSFKGRGTDYLLECIGPHETGFVCASAGNFGQGIAYAARKRHRRVTVFAAVNANPLKVERMRALGATVLLEGEDFDAAKTAARGHADQTGAMFIEDGREAPIAEGAGTIALELTGMRDQLDAVMVPLGDGALITGIGTWMREKSPRTAVIGVVAEGAPAMDLSWRAGQVVLAEASTIADGIAVSKPVAGALAAMQGNLDAIERVTDEEIIDAMRLLHEHAGLVVEPAGAAGLAAVARRSAQLSGRRVGVIITGGNVTPDQIRRWIL